MPKNAVGSISNIPLLVFAHQPEAKAFIANDRLNLSDNYINEKFGKLYEGESYHLLITHGGAERTIFSVTHYLSQNKYQQIYNLGFAGALNSNVKLGETTLINVSYGMREKKPFFESFSLSNTKEILNAVFKKQLTIQDCLSVIKPPLQSKSKKKLQPFADVVDMELWWLGFAANRFNVPLTAIKIISDLSTDKTNKQQIIDASANYSNKLYDTLHTLGLLEKVKTKKLNKRKSSLNDLENTLDTVNLREDFHLTFSQKKIIHSLISQLQKLKHNLIDSKNINLDEISTLDISPKQRTNLLIDKLKELCYPNANRYLKTTNRLIQSAQKKGYQLQLDPQLEKYPITCSFTVNSIAEWNKITKNLPHKEVETLFAFLNGEIAPEQLSSVKTS